MPALHPIPFTIPHEYERENPCTLPTTPPSPDSDSDVRFAFWCLYAHAVCFLYVPYSRPPLSFLYDRFASRPDPYPRVGVAFLPVRRGDTCSRAVPRRHCAVKVREMARGFLGADCQRMSVLSGYCTDAEFLVSGAYSLAALFLRADGLITCLYAP